MMEPEGYLMAGRVALWLGLAGAVASLVMYGRLALAGGADGGVEPELTPSRERQTQLARSLYVFAAALVVFAWIYFVWQLLAHNFQSVYVFQHSSREMPLKYIFAASWAGQAGSFFIWLLWAWIVGLVVMRTSGRREAGVMSAYMVIPAILIGTLLVTRPFQLWPEVPADGAGLNPLLRDPWMVIHPPVMFLGYVGVSVPFAFAAASIREGDYDGWVAPALPWALFGWVVLGIAIVMGGFWAYKTLGWGGWWGWDPVENASLLPWLTATGLVHGMVLQKNRGKMRRTNALMAGITFLLVLYSTYLTRSGALEGASVHSFVTPGLAKYLTLILVAGVALLLFSLARNYRRMRSDPLSEHLFSREVAFFLMAVLFAMMALLVGLGTSAPLFTGWFRDNPSLVDIGFYARTVGPLGLLMAVLMGLAPLVGWKGSRTVPGELAWSVAAAGTLAAIGLMVGLRRPFELLFLGAVGLALGTNVIAFLRSYDRGGIRRAGGYAAHLGVVLMLISILAQSAGRQVKVDLDLQEPTEVMGMTMTFQGWTAADVEGGKQAVVVDVERGGRSFRTYPKIYQIFGGGDWMTRTEPYIHRTIFADLYIAPAQYEPRTIADVGGALLSLAKGEHAPALGYDVLFEGFDFDADHMGTGENTAWAVLHVSRDGAEQRVRPALRVSQEGVTSERAILQPLSDGTQHVIMIDGLNVDAGSVDLLIFDAGAHATDPEALGGVLTLEVSTKPLMGLLWLGVLIVVLGGGTAAWRRTREVSNP